MCASDMCAMEATSLPIAKQRVVFALLPLLIEAFCDSHTPPLHPCSARAAAALPEDLPPAAHGSAPPRLPFTIQLLPETSPQEAAVSAQDLPSSQSDLHTPVAAPPESMGHMFTPEAGEAVVDGEDSTIDSPAFDESFAMDAQLVLGGLITPATALRPEAAQHMGQDAQVIPLQQFYA